MQILSNWRMVTGGLSSRGSVRCSFRSPGGTIIWDAKRSWRQLYGLQTVGPLSGNDGSVAEKMDACTLRLDSDDSPSSDKDDFDSNRLNLEWKFLRNPRDEDWSLEERSGWLTLHGSATTLNEIGSPAFVGRRQQHFRCTVTTLLSFASTNEGEEAGLTVYMNERFHFEIALTRTAEGHRKVILRKRIGSLWKVELEEEYEGIDIILGLEAEPS